MLVGWLGVLLAGCISGSFTVPARRLRVMSWDGAWLIYCTVANLLIPCLLGLLFAAPVFTRVFPKHLPLVAAVLLAGAMFGCGAFLFGSCVPRLGVALSNAIVSGTVALVGSLSPLLTGSTRLTIGDLTSLLFGLFVLATGIAASCYASMLRDQADERQPSLSVALHPLAGVLLALLAGCLASMLNAGFVYGQPLMKYAVEQGVAPACSSLAVWIPILAGAFVVNVVATHLRLVQTGGYTLLSRSPSSDWLRAMTMGLLWSGAILVYGVCSQILGSIGAVYGWALFVGASILIAIVWGIWLGEWTTASSQAKQWLWVSLLLILLSLLVLSIRES
jgi:L-rhamnose-H+ transport protein